MSTQFIQTKIHTPPYSPEEFLAEVLGILSGGNVVLGRIENGDGLRVLIPETLTGRLRIHGSTIRRVVEACQIHKLPFSLVRVEPREGSGRTKRSSPPTQWYLWLQGRKQLTADEVRTADEILNLLSRRRGLIRALENRGVRLNQLFENFGAPTLPLLHQIRLRILGNGANENEVQSLYFKYREGEVGAEDRWTLHSHW